MSMSEYKPESSDSSDEITMVTRSNAQWRAARLMYLADRFRLVLRTAIGIRWYRLRIDSKARHQ